jgi:ABC-type Na+ efflux pump permease subunit
MNLRHSWIIASKDLRAFIRKRTVLYAVVALPLILSILFPVILGRENIQASIMPRIVDAFAFFYVIIPAIIPTPIASYSIVGEKVEKSLEPLLVTPITDGEILLGKSIAAFVPAILATYVGATIFMTLVDTMTHAKLGYFYYPNWGIGVILLLLAPIVALMSIELNVIASSRLSDVRTASQLGGVMFLPFIGIYLAGETGVITLDTNTLLVIAAILAVLDLVLFYVSTRTFQREQILTKWK